MKWIPIGGLNLSQVIDIASPFWLITLCSSSDSSRFNLAQLPIPLLNPPSETQTGQNKKESAVV